MAITQDAGVGAYIGVPLHDLDGQLYGTLDEPNDLGTEDLAVSRNAAGRLEP